MPAWEENAEQISQIDVFTYIGRHLRKNGSESSVEVNTIPFHYDGNEYYLSVARNITNRVSILKRLKKTRKNSGLYSTKPATVYGTGARVMTQFISTIFSGIQGKKKRPVKLRTV